MDDLTAAIVLAAGEGKRMKSSRPKVLHRLAGRTMIEHVLDSIRAARIDRVICVIPPGADEIDRALDSRDDVVTVVQPEPRGTGDAVRCAMGALGRFDGPVVLCCGDTPLLSSETLRGLLKTQHDSDAPATLLVAEVDDPAGYGRVIVRDGLVERIVEERDADRDERQIRLINTGVYCVDWKTVSPLFDRLDADNEQGEVYLTDIMAHLWTAGAPGQIRVIDDVDEAHGVNDRAQLARADRVLRDRIRHELMASGVSLVDPAATWVDAGVRVGADTTLHAAVVIEGRTRIGAGCDIGPFTRIVDCEIGDGVRLAGWNHLRGVTLPDGSTLEAFERRGE